jgi:hypothetical protein
MTELVKVYRARGTEHYPTPEGIELARCHVDKEIVLFGCTCSVETVEEADRLFLERQPGSYCYFNPNLRSSG